jgi:hypothetical protein
MHPKPRIKGCQWEKWIIEKRKLLTGCGPELASRVPPYLLQNKLITGTLRNEVVVKAEKITSCCAQSRTGCRTAEKLSTRASMGVVTGRS